jgi:hypothetical protein
MSLKIELNNGKVIVKDDTTSKVIQTKSKIQSYEDNPEFQNINAILDKYRYYEI